MTDDAWLQHFFREGRHGRVAWRGVRITKLPLDMVVFAEVIHEVRPEIIVETGTQVGGSAFFFADMLQLAGIEPEVITVDILEEPGLYRDPRVAYIQGDSIADETIADVWSRVSNQRCMVILDSNHSAEHVLREMEAYAGLVSSESYLIVEDSCLGGHPLDSGTEPGPMAAIERFLPQHPEFTIDLWRERFGPTFNPSGWLRRA